MTCQICFDFYDPAFSRNFWLFLPESTETTLMILTSIVTAAVACWVVLWYRFSLLFFQGLTWKAFEKALENTCVTTNLKKEDSARTAIVTVRSL